MLVIGRNHYRPVARLYSRYGTDNDNRCMGDPTDMVHLFRPLAGYSLRRRDVLCESVLHDGERARMEERSRDYVSQITG